MIPESMYQPDNHKRAKEFFSEPVMRYAMGHVLGGFVNQVPKNATAINPAVRAIGQEILFSEKWMEAHGINESISVLNKYVPPPSSCATFNHDGRNLKLLNPLGEPHGLDWQQLYWYGLSQYIYRVDLSTYIESISIQSYIISPLSLHIHHKRKCTFLLSQTHT